ncbi:MAG: class I SAM-dependent DNA methyltransferase, partial [Acidimicrobiales bacterium]
LGLHRVLDAGCGTGRVAIELDRLGCEVVGVDVDEAMLAEARTKAPHLEWVGADLSTVELDGTFDGVVMAGNVMIFVTPGTEGAVVANLTRHLVGGGLLVAGFSVEKGRLPLAVYDDLASAAGLELVDRWATWDREVHAPGHDYAVSVHRKV